MVAGPRVTKEKKPRRDAGEWRPAFLRGLEVCPVVGEACKAAHISRKTAYEWRERDEAFRKEWDQAVEAGLDGLEAALIERGKKRDTTAAIFILKHRRPEIYRERHEVTGRDGAPLIAHIYLPDNARG